MPRGGKRLGAGRPKGSRSRGNITQAAVQKLERTKRSTGQLRTVSSLLSRVFDMAFDEELAPTDRLRAGLGVLAFVLPRPQLVELRGDVEVDHTVTSPKTTKEARELLKRVTGADFE